MEHSKLLSWFKLNSEDPAANKYLYTEITEHYVYHTKQKKWMVRKRCANKVISRMLSVRPNEGERFYLRLLLLHVHGAKSFDYLRTVDGVLYNTFREACSALGLLQGDAEWRNTLQEAANFQLPCQLRQLFGVILTYCEPCDPMLLRESFKCDDKRISSLGVCHQMMLSN